MVAGAPGQENRERGTGPWRLSQADRLDSGVERASQDTWVQIRIIFIVGMHLHLFSEVNAFALNNLALRVFLHSSLHGWRHTLIQPREETSVW